MKLSFLSFRETSFGRLKSSRWSLSWSECKILKLDKKFSDILQKKINFNSSENVCTQLCTLLCHGLWLHNTCWLSHLGPSPWFPSTTQGVGAPNSNWTTCWTQCQAGKPATASFPPEHDRKQVAVCEHAVGCIYRPDTRLRWSEGPATPCSLWQGPSPKAVWLWIICFSHTSSTTAG